MDQPPMRRSSSPAKTRTRITWIDFGDGVNGARLTTGVNNVIATYRTEAERSSPPAGKLTVIAQSLSRPADRW